MARAHLLPEIKDRAEAVLSAYADFTVAAERDHSLRRRTAMPVPNSPRGIGDFTEAPAFRLPGPGRHLQGEGTYLLTIDTGSSHAGSCAR